MKKIISLFLSFLMVAALLPYNVWAMELSEENEAAGEEIHECEIEGEHFHEEEIMQEESVSEEVQEVETVQPEEPLEEETITEEINNEAETLGAASVVASGDCGASGSSVKWKLDSNGVLTIYGSGAMKDYGYIATDSLSVTTAPWGEYKDSLKSLIIEEGITEIGNNAFWCCSNFICKLIIPDGVKVIGDSAFSYCSGFTGELVLPDSLISIGISAFYGCRNIKGGLIIPNNVKTIGMRAFSQCFGFNGNLIIGNKVEEIGIAAFGDCGFTGNTVLPASVKNMGSAVFCSTKISGITVAEENQYYKAIDGIVYSKDGKKLLDCPGGKTGMVSIPEGVTYIGDYAFRDNTNLTGKLVIPDSVTTIGYTAFEGCNGFTELIIGESIATIDGFAFSDCTGLTGDLVFSENIKTIDKGVFKNCGIDDFYFEGDAPIVYLASSDYFPSFDSSDDTIYYPSGNSAWSISNGEWNGYTAKTWNPSGSENENENENENNSIVASGDCGASGGNLKWTLDSNGTLTISGEGKMADYVSSGENVAPWIIYKSSLKKLVIEEGITKIGNYAFFGCNAFTGNLIIPDSVTTIGDSAFYGCNGFNGNLVVGRKIKTIGDSAFCECFGFVGSVDLGYISNIGERAFRNCGINDYYFLGICPTMTTAGDSSYYATFDKDSDILYYVKGKSGWGSVWDKYNKKTYAIAASYTGDIDWIILNEGTLVISGKGQIPDYGSNCAPWASYCDEIKSLDIKEGVTTIGSNAFTGFDLGGTGSSECFTFPESIVSIGTCSFESCKGFTAIILSKNVEIIGERAFYNCEGVSESVIIPKKVKRINSLAFYKCGADEYFFVGDAPTSISSSSFEKEKDIIYYPKGNPTWEITDGKWNGYKAIEWEPCQGSDFGKHILGDWNVFKAATCTEPGEERKYCENCDYYESRATEATGHSYTQKIVAPTCTEQGYTLNECHCGESYKNKFVAETGHSGGTATCVEQKTCKVCGEKYGKFDLENHGNNGTTIENTKEATCCEIGYTGDKICNDCKLVIEKGKEIAINSDNHANYGTEEDKNSAIAPDCKNSGKKANIICSGCKEIVKIGDTIPATGNHKGGTATCSEQKTCENCGDKYGELDPKNHGNNGTTLVNVKEATCREKGYTGDKVCKGCEVVVEKGESTAINPKNHGDYGTEKDENSAVEPDCKNAGKKADMLCSGCKAVVKIGDVIPATGNHIGGTATCTEKAICSECGDKYGNTDSNNHGEHSITVEDVKDATCVEKGYTGNKVCSGCKGIVEKGSDTEATGHDFDEWYVTVEPTFSDKGEDRRDCKKCDYFETRATAKTDDGKTDVIITISSGKIINKKNEKISVTAEMTQGVKEIQFNLKYDPKVIKLVSCQKGDNFKNATLGVGTSGNVYFTWKSDEEIFEADLFEIEFAQIDGTAIKTTEITIDSENGFAFLDKYGEKVSSEIVAGTVDFVEVDYGDVNNDGKVTVMDVFLARLLAAKLIHLDELQELSADVDGDGAISAVDANIIRKYAVKIITVFPAEGTHVHNYYRKNVTVAPTCTLPGTQTAYCACGKFITESVSPLGHDYVGVVKEEANCIKKGTKTYTCSRCNDSYNELIPVNNNHNYSGKVTKEATCGSKGVMTYTCSLCKKSYTEEIAATGKHNYTAKVTKAATCTESGIKTCTCSVCKDSFTETISATGHSWNSATCTEPSVCKNCGITSGEKLGHNYSGKITKEATCGAKGVKTFTCSVCKDSYTEEIAATGNHNHIPKITKAATCGAKGVKTFTCSVCGDSYTEDIPATNAHNYSTRTTKNPTCTAEGTKTSTCSVCKHSYEERIPANGHNWSSATCTAAKKCRTCGVTSGSALGHNYVGVSCTTGGKCSRCGATTAAWGHSYLNGKCIDCGAILAVTEWTRDEFGLMWTGIQLSIDRSMEAIRYAKKAADSKYMSIMNGYIDLAKEELLWVRSNIYHIDELCIGKPDFPREDTSVFNELLEALYLCEELLNTNITSEVTCEIQAATYYLKVMKLDSHLKAASNIMADYSVYYD